MEANLCDDVNHLDSDVLLPPRKRLLAGLKKQNFDCSSLPPSTSCKLSEFDIRLNNLLRSHLSNHNLSAEDIVESSRLAAAAALEVAKSSRAVAEEKAIMASKAIAAAKSALELVATVSEAAASRETYLKKNKMKKHLPVQMLYNKDQHVENCRTDEELARKLHRAMNTSPRICKNPSISEPRNKRLKGLYTTEKTRVPNGVTSLGGNPPTSNGNGVTRKVDSEGSLRQACGDGLGENTLEVKQANWFKTDKGEVETSNSKEKRLESLDDTCNIGRKRGRIKQKKLPLSICTFKDRANPKEELKRESSRLTEDKTTNTTSTSMPLFSVEPPPDGVVPVKTTKLWKCQALKAPPIVKQNKVMQS
ncbi:hypothetical protein NMG60_11026419 [Bertholletia excelsa]